MSLKTIVNFNNALDFTYDPTKIEVVNSKAILKDALLPSELAYYDFTNNDAIPKRGNNNIVLANGATISTQELHLNNSNQARARIPSTSITTQVGSLQFKWKPLSATTAGSQTIARLYDPTGASPAHIHIYWSNQGGGVSRIRLQITNDAGGSLVSALYPITLSALSTYDMLLSYDFTNGDTRLFLDGVQILFPTATGTLTKTPDFVLAFGETVGFTQNPNYDIDNIQTFSSAIKYLDGDSFSSPVPDALPYELGEHTICLNSQISLKELVDFDALDVTPALTQVGYLLVLGGVKYYHTGASWVISNGTLLQTNTIAQIQANADSLPITISAFLQFCIVMETTDREITPEVDWVSMEYSFYAPVNEPNRCAVFGTTVDVSGNPVGGAKITISSSDSLYNENAVLPDVSVFSDALGQYRVAVIETTTFGTSVDITIEYKQNGKIKKYKRLGYIIPNQPEASIDSLVKL